MGIGDLYTVENAEKFEWSSVTGVLNPDRQSHLESYVIGHKVLDAGCGGGAFVDFLSGKGFDVTGIDKYDQFLEIACQKRYHGNFVRGDVCDIPFDDKTFDCSYCFDVLEHVDDQAAIRELARVTKKRLIVAVPKEAGSFWIEYGLTYAHYRDQTHLRYYTEASLTKLLGHVNPTRICVLPELRVPYESLIQEMLGANLRDLPLVPPFPQGKSLKSFIKAAILNLGFVRRTYQAAYSNLLGQMLTNASREADQVGLVGIADL